MCHMHLTSTEAGDNVEKYIYFWLKKKSSIVLREVNQKIKTILTTNTIQVLKRRTNMFTALSCGNTSLNHMVLCIVFRSLCSATGAVIVYVLQWFLQPTPADNDGSSIARNREALGYLTSSQILSVSPSISLFLYLISFFEIEFLCILSHENHHRPSPIGLQSLIFGHV